MRVSIWAHDANELVDPPAYHRSEAYADNLVVAGRAVTCQGGYKLFPPPSPPAGHERKGSMRDWKNIQVSVVPGKLLGDPSRRVAPLFVTTRQFKPKKT